MYIPLLPSSTAPIILSDGGNEFEYPATPTGYAEACKSASLSVDREFTGEVCISQAGVILARIFADGAYRLILERRGPDGVLHGAPYEVYS